MWTSIQEILWRGGLGTNSNRQHCGYVTNYEVRRRTGQPLLSDTVRTRRLKLFGLHVAGQRSSKIIPVLYKPAYRPLQGTGGGVQAEEGGGRSDSILDSCQGSEEHKTDQLGGHSQESNVTDKLRLTIKIQANQNKRLVQLRGRINTSHIF